MNPVGNDKPLILVVDDTASNLALLLDLLSESGYRVAVAEDGESALELASYTRPDLILLDVLIPAIDGFAACARLKANPTTRDIPVIFMTALADTVDKVKGFELGAVDYITKPFQIAEVRARVATHLSIQQLSARLQENEQRLANVFNSVFDAIVMFNAEGRITRLNRAAERVFRVDSGDAIGEPCKRFLSPGLCKTLSDYLSDGGDALPAPLWIGEGNCAVRADGETFPVEASLSCAETAGQKLYTFILRDIDERKKAEARVLQLQGLNRYLDEELRNALGRRRGDRRIGGHARGHGTGAASRLHRCDGAHHRRDRHRQGARRARDPSARVTRKDRPFVKLNCAALPADADRERAVRPREGRLHRRARATRRPLRARRRRHAVPRRDRRAAARPAGEAAARAAGGRVRARRRHRDRCRWTCASSPRPTAIWRSEVAAGQLPRGPLLPPQRVPDRAAAAARAPRGHSAARRALPARATRAKYGKRIDALPDAQLATLRGYRWPGNVRELRKRHRARRDPGAGLAPGPRRLVWPTPPPPTPLTWTTRSAPIS